MPIFFRPAKPALGRVVLLSDKCSRPCATPIDASDRVQVSHFTPVFRQTGSPLLDTPQAGFDPIYLNRSQFVAAVLRPVTKLLQKQMDAAAARLNNGVLVRFLV